MTRPPDPLATVRMDLISYKGRSLEHWLNPTDPQRTLCGKRAHQTQPPQGSRPCVTCGRVQDRRKRAKS